MTYAQRIRELRQKNGETQEEIAKILQTTQQYYGKYENGIRPLPIQHLEKLCKHWNVSADYILGLKEDK